jgi:excisionase family DNA binding protein
MTETIGSDDCAKLLRCTVEQAEELARSGDIPGTKFGREWLFVRADLIAYIAERARKEATERRAKRSPGAPTPIKRKPARRVAPALPVVALQ